jgi:c(7)-type cytochrome triheme protein
MKIISLVMLALFCASAALAAETKNEAPQQPYDESAYGPEAPIVWEKPVKAVEFQHKTHTMGAGLECDACHDSLFVQESGAAEKKDDFTMATLYKGGYCGSCHDGQTAFSSHTRCTACHIGARGQKRQEAEKKGEILPATSH